MVTEFLDRVRNALRTQGVTAGALAKRAQLHRNTLYGWDKPDWNPSTETLRRLEPLIDEIETTGSLAESDTPALAIEGREVA